MAKVRSCLVLSVPADDRNRALLTIVPHTTSTRGSSFEVVIEERFLKPGAFDAQNLATIPQAKLIRRLGRLSNESLSKISIAVKAWLGM